MLEHGAQLVFRTSAPPNVLTPDVGEFATGSYAEALLRPCVGGYVNQARSGQVYYSAEVQDHESHKAAYATSEHRLSKSSYARIVT